MSGGSGEDARWDEDVAPWLAPFQGAGGGSQVRMQLEGLRARLNASGGDAEAQRLQGVTQAVYVDRPYALWHFILAETKAQWALDQLVDELAGRPALTPFCEVFWALKRMGFTDPQIAQLDFRGLRTVFLQLSECIRRLRRPGLGPPGGGEVRRVAILSTQLLDLHHSPTREAIHLALRLINEHGLEVTLFNLNALTYTTTLGLVTSIVANHNPDLKGLMTLQTGVAGFREPDVRCISLEPGPPTAEKVLGVLELLTTLQVDAVLSHADNHVYQDVVYGLFPSLFLTTGEVLPFARSDAYWAPGSLVTDAHDALANAFGGGPILREQMLTSPEDVDVPAVDRASLGVDADALVYIVIGRRLELEVDAEFASVADRLLQRRPRASILFCGSPALDLPAVFGPTRVASGQVRNLGLREDLAAVCRAADVCLNPRRTGGGTSAQTAILCGLPVITLANGHVSDVVPPDRRWAAYDDYVAYALRLGEDAALRRVEAERFADHLQWSASPSGQVSRIVARLAELHRTYAARAAP